MQGNSLGKIDGSLGTPRDKTEGYVASPLLPEKRSLVSKKGGKPLAHVAEADETHTYVHVYIRFLSGQCRRVVIGDVLENLYDYQEKGEKNENESGEEKPHLFLGGRLSRHSGNAMAKRLYPYMLPHHALAENALGYPEMHHLAAIPGNEILHHPFGDSRKIGNLAPEKVVDHRIFLEVHPDDISRKNLSRRNAPDGIHHGRAGNPHLKGSFLFFEFFEIFLEKRILSEGFFLGLLLLKEGIREKLRKFLKLFHSHVRANPDEDDTVALGSFVKIVLKLMAYHRIRIVPAELHHPELVGTVLPEALDVEIVFRRRGIIGKRFDMLQHGLERSFILYGNAELPGISLPGYEGAQTSFGKNPRIQKGFVSLVMTNENVSPEGLEYVIFRGIEVHGLCQTASPPLSYARRRLVLPVA
jgi:hypothetical protein